MAQTMPAMMNCPLSKAQPIPEMKCCLVSKSPVVVIGREFLADHPVVLNIKRETTEFIVNDAKGNVLFSFNGRVLLDAYGKPLVTLQQEKLSGHRGWQVFRGDCTDHKHLLFSVRRSSVAQLTTELDVFLANINPKEHVPNFKVKGSWLEATISRVDLQDIIAMILDQLKERKLIGCPNSCVGTVCPNVDYAFITTLMLILKLSGDLKEDGNSCGN